MRIHCKPHCPNLDWIQSSPPPSVCTTPLSPPSAGARLCTLRRLCSLARAWHPPPPLVALQPLQWRPGRGHGAEQGGEAALQHVVVPLQVLRAEAAAGDQRVVLSGRRSSAGGAPPSLPTVPSSQGPKGEGLQRWGRGAEALGHMDALAGTWGPTQGAFPAQSMEKILPGSKTFCKIACSGYYSRHDKMTKTGDKNIRLPVQSAREDISFGSRGSRTLPRPAGGGSPSPPVQNQLN